MDDRGRVSDKKPTPRQRTASISWCQWIDAKGPAGNCRYWTDCPRHLLADAVVTAEAEMLAAGLHGGCIIAQSRKGKLLFVRALPSKTRDRLAELVGPN